MNGYWSNCSAQATALSASQMTTTIVWNARNRAVPSVRAMVSANRPNASGS